MPTLRASPEDARPESPDPGHGVLHVHAAVPLEPLALEVVDHRAGHLLEVLPVEERPVLHAHQVPAHPEHGVLSRLEMDVGRAEAHGLPQDAGELHRSSLLLPGGTRFARPRGTPRPGSKRIHFRRRSPSKSRFAGVPETRAKIAGRDESGPGPELPAASAPTRDAAPQGPVPRRWALRHQMDRDGLLRARPGPGRGRPRRAGAAPAKRSRLDVVAAGRRRGRRRQPGGVGVLRARSHGGPPGIHGARRIGAGARRTAPTAR